MSEIERIEVEAAVRAAEAAIREMQADELDTRLPDNYKDYEDSDDFILHHDPIDYRWDRW